MDVIGLSTVSNCYLCTSYLQNYHFGLFHNYLLPHFMYAIIIRLSRTRGVQKYKSYLFSAQRPAYTVKPVLSGPCSKRNFSYTEIFLCPVILRPKHMLNTLD
jgi:hypothetical protein